MLTTRRQFLKTSGTALASTAILSSMPLGLLSCNTSGKPKDFGFQVWTIRQKLLEDFEGTLQMMAGLGYTQVEMCSPLGYTGAGFGPLNEMSGTEMKRIIDGTGLSCISSHYTMGELRENLDNRIEWATEMGMKQMVCSMFWLPEEATIDDWKKACHELNVIAEKTQTAGIQMGYHNHHFEFQKIDGELIYPVLMQELDPELVKMQFQVAVVDMGYQAADYFREYPGRFISAHLADYSPEQEAQVPIGKGMVDWDDFFLASRTGGVQNFFVEMDPLTFEESAAFLKA